MSFWFFGTGEAIKEVGWKKFKEEMLLTDDVAKLDVVNNEIVEVYIKPSSLEKDKFKDLHKKKGLTRKIGDGPHFSFTIGSVDVFHDQIKEA